MLLLVNVGIDVRFIFLCNSPFIVFVVHLPHRMQWCKMYSIHLYSADTSAVQRFLSFTLVPVPIRAHNLNPD